ncbi:jg3581 [Pararge aegeria aegeria]|uniref:Jg3581 protein n=1 Tax=Pararge aegeria aegeria TaxID=348720 RepID=A0A8S4SBC8_9NEOP|nr:jg3581 [Pararge aegeria aegeria]
MQILRRLVLAQSILIIYFKLCSTKVYFKPDDAFVSDLRSSLISDENNDLLIVLPHNLEPAGESNEILNVAVLKLGGKAQETEQSYLDTQETDVNGLNHRKTDELDVNPRETDELDTNSQESAESDLEIGDLNLNSVQRSMLRKRWHSKCDKKASKTCRNACKNAYKIVCSSFKCRSRMKKDFRRECKRNCKSKFVSSVSSIETE